jgi:hypothetical protein
VAKRRPRKDRSGDHYLHLCPDSGIVVVAYSDDASGVEIVQADGAGF